ncbi:alpha-glucosidase C-terminal domain-containing protein, partial [Actinomadura sp. 6K520]|uniref:alpha-glucosidase C-terminal domain-containing protein n=1 Tax=Actinomadura sp. 6K520 TaxID=2530364 RepID=UPI0010DF444F
GSLLHWTRKMIEIRQRHPVFGVGSYVELSASNPSVLAFTREITEEESPWDEMDTILCVSNLSRFPQPVELDLRRFEGYSPVECMGGVQFPAIGELPYLMTLPAHGFFWFQLIPPDEGDGVPETIPGGAAGTLPGTDGTDAAPGAGGGTGAGKAG